MATTIVRIGRRLSIDGRVNKLECKFGIAGHEQKYVVVLTDRNIGDAEQDTYVQILDDAGFLPSAGFGMVDLTVIPRGLSTKEEEKFVRENATELCRSHLLLIAR
jgi:hypothetical protein